MKQAKNNKVSHEDKAYWQAEKDRITKCNRQREEINDRMKRAGEYDSIKRLNTDHPIRQKIEKEVLGVDADKYEWPEPYEMM